jgi:hypothetical protein
MLIAASFTSVVLALAMLGSGVMKLRRAPALVSSMATVNVGGTLMQRLGLIEVAATVGLLVGLFWAPIGIAAAAGATIYFIGAVVAHLRVGDKGFGAAAGLAVLAIATVVLRTLAL